MRDEKPPTGTAFTTGIESVRKCDFTCASLDALFSIRKV